MPRYRNSKTQMKETRSGQLKTVKPYERASKHELDEMFSAFLRPQPVNKPQVTPAEAVQQAAESNLMAAEVAKAEAFMAQAEAQQEEAGDPVWMAVEQDWDAFKEIDMVNRLDAMFPNTEYGSVEDLDAAIALVLEDRASDPEWEKKLWDEFMASKGIVEYTADLEVHFVDEGENPYEVVVA